MLPMFMKHIVRMIVFMHFVAVFVVTYKPKNTIPTPHRRMTIPAKA